MKVKEFIEVLETLPKNAKIDYGMSHYCKEGLKEGEASFNLHDLFKTGKIKIYKKGRIKIITMECDE